MIDKTPNSIHKTMFLVIKQIDIDQIYHKNHIKYINKQLKMANFLIQ